MKTTIERIFETLSESTKVELASEKIELSVAGDIKKGINKVKALLKQMSASKKSVQKARDVFESAGDKARNITDEANSFYNAQIDVQEKAEKIAKELGVNAGDISGFNVLDDLLFDLKKAEKELDDLADIT